MTGREPAWRRYLAFFRPSVQRDLDDELRFHREERVADLISLGRTEREAREEAAREFGDPELYRSRVLEIDRRMERRRNRSEWLSIVADDIRLTLRGMRRAPALTGMVVTTLALGIGANGAIFSILDRVFLRPPPGVAAPGELLRIVGDYKGPPPTPSYTRQVFGLDEVKLLRAGLDSLAPVAGYRSERFRLGWADDSPFGQVADVHGRYFQLLGVKPFMGRLFGEDEMNRESAAKVVVVSHHFWERQLGADAGAIGKTVTIGRAQYRIVGIASPDFAGIDLDAIDMWRPANLSEPYYGPGSASIRLIARSASLDVANRLSQRANFALSGSDDLFAKRTTLRTETVRFGRDFGGNSQANGIAKRLAGVTLIVLLIAIANVANLLLTRAIQRQREIAIRVSLGVSRARLAAQLFTETAVMAVIAGCAALLVGMWGALLMRRLLFPDVRWSDSPFDPRLAIFTFSVALAAGLFAGLLPLARAGRLDLAHAIRGGARDGAYRSRTRATMIVAQAALSVVLLAGAGAFVRSLRTVYQLDLGYDPRGVIIAGLYSGERVVPYAERAAGLVAVRDRIATLPGVRSAGLSSLEPMGGIGFTELHFPGRDSIPRTAGGGPTFTAVSPEYFKAMGVSIISGRGFAASDNEGAPRVMVVTQTMARVAWPSINPIGQCVKVGKISEPCTTVVGVIEDVRRDDIVEREMLMFFLPIAQAPAFARQPGSLIVRADPAAVDAVRAQVRSALLAAVPGTRPDIATFVERLDPQYRPWRTGASLFSGFGLLALIVAAVGVYSAISYAVTQRAHELGVRMALGAQRRQIATIVVSSGLRLVGVGVAVGIGVTMGLGRLIESLLYGTSAHDPAVLGVSALLLMMMTMLAAGIPAWRASRLDPVNALRAE